MIKEWWNKERVNRVEKGTSQDICPTNGGSVTWCIMCFAIWGIILSVLFIYRR